MDFVLRCCRRRRISAPRSPGWPVRACLCMFSMAGFHLPSSRLSWLISTMTSGVSAPGRNGLSVIPNRSGATDWQACARATPVVSGVREGALCPAFQSLPTWVQHTTDGPNVDLFAPDPRRSVAQIRHPVDPGTVCALPSRRAVRWQTRRRLQADGLPSEDGFRAPPLGSPSRICPNRSVSANA